MSALEKQVNGDHYKTNYQVVELVAELSLSYFDGNVIKYLTRHAAKNGVADLDKAIHYLELKRDLRVPTSGLGAGGVRLTKLFAKVNDLTPTEYLCMVSLFTDLPDKVIDNMAALKSSVYPA